MSLGNSTNTPFNPDPDGIDIDFGFGIAFTTFASLEKLGVSSYVTSCVNALKALLPSGLFYSESDLPSITALLTNVLTSYATVLFNPESTKTQKAAAAETAATTLNKAIPFEIWQPIAVVTMDNYYDKTIPILINKKLSNFSSLSPEGQTALQMMTYVSGIAFLGKGESKLVAALEQDTPNYASAAYELAFDTAHVPAKASGKNAYISYENRCLISTSLMLGLNPTTNGYNYVTGVADIAANNATLVEFMQDASNNFASVERYLSLSLHGGAPAAYFYDTLKSYLLGLGYYVPLPTDGNSLGMIAASIAAQLGTANDISISGAEIQRINAILPASSISTGGLVYVPTTAVFDQFGLGSPALPGQTLVLDSAPATLQTAAVIYTVGSSLDGSDTGALFIIDKNDADNLRFDAGTWSYYSESSISGDVIVRVTLAALGPIPLATLTLDAFTNTETITLLDGDPVYTTTLSGSVHIYDPPATSEQVLLGYLSSLGDSITAAELEQSNLDYLNPTGPTYTVTGSVVNVNNTSADVYYTAYTPGAIIAGQSTATITVNGHPKVVAATNFLDVGDNGYSDFSQDTISGVQVLNTESSGFAGSVELTQAEFAKFGTITGGGVITAADGGIFSLLAANVDPSADYTQLIATDTGSTTLIGNGVSNQILTASPLGDDTLEAGNGTGDVLNAGEGVDTLIGGTGGDTFVAYSYGPLAAGSIITGNGAENTLEAYGDLSAITLSGVQTLSAIGNITLTASECAGFTNVDLDNGTLYAATSGVYDLSEKDSTGSVDMVALSDGGTTLTAGDGDGDYYQTLIASPTGNDTLKVGNGYGNRLVGGGGNCTLIAGSGEFDILTSNGLVDTLTAGNGDGDILTGGFGQDSLTVGNGNGDSLTSNGRADTLTAGNGAGDVVTASFLGTDELKVGFGAGDKLNAGEGMDTLIGGTGGDTFTALDGLTSGSRVIGQGSGNTLSANGVISGATITDIQTLDTGFITLSAAQLSGFVSIVYDGRANAGTIYAATGGMFDLASMTRGTFDLTALASVGTTLIGAGGANEILTASVAGNDSLEDAGVLVAGGGVDTFIGGREVQAFNGLVAGCVLTNDTELETSGSIAQDSISGVNDLDIAGASLAVTLTGSQLAHFSYILAATAGSSLAITTAGAYNLTSNLAATGDALSLEALATTGTTLEENGTASVQLTDISLTASASGNDTLLSSNARGVTLNASGSAGNDILTLSGGARNVLEAASSTGTDTITITGGTANTVYAGNGTDTITTAGSTANTIYAGNGTDTITIKTANDLSGGDGIAIYAGGGMDTIADNSSFASNPADGGTVNTIYCDSGTAIIETSTYGGDDIIGGAGTDMIYVNGACTLTGGTGNDTVFLEQLSTSLSLTGGIGSNTLIIVSSALGTIAQSSISNFQTLSVSAALTVSQSQFDALTALVNTSAAAATLTVDGSSAATYSLNSLAVSGDFNLADSASDRSAVTLIGNSQAAQVLTAGAGTDTLIAGNGKGDQLIAGTGTDTLTGGTGADSFIINAAGTVANINGGTSDTVFVSGASVSATIKGGGNTIDVSGKTDSMTDAGSGANTFSLTGTSDTAIIDNAASDSLVLGGKDNSIDVKNTVARAGTVFIGGTSPVLEFAGATSDLITFGSASGLLKLDTVASFGGSLTGFASGDAVDLVNFLFSGSPTVSGVTGTGAQGTYTDVTVTDGAKSVIIPLLNQLVNEYGLTASDYSLSADTAASPGTLFYLATAH